MHVFEEYLVDFLGRNTNSIYSEDLTYLLNLLSSSKKRPIKVLKAVSDLLLTRLAHSSFQPEEAEHLAGTLFCLNKLSYIDKELLEALCKNLTQVDPSVAVCIKRNTLVSLLTALGRFRWCHEPLLSRILNSVPDIMKSRRVLGSHELVCLLVTLSKLGYKPSNLKDIWEKNIRNNIVRDKISQESVWIDFLWALAFLDLAGKKDPLMKEVLDSSSPFVKSVELKVREGDVASRTDFCKILNIQGLLLGSPSSNGRRKRDPVTFGKQEEGGEGDKSLFEPPPRSQDCLSFSKNVTDTLNFFIPQGSHMELGIRTNLGFTIDARFVISADMKTLALDKVPSLPSLLVPQGLHRVNVLTASFRHTLLNDPSQAAGQLKMYARIVREVLGETVVVVAPDPFSSKNDAVQKVSLLQKLIKEAIYQV
jgi:hypothetical protein